MDDLWEHVDMQVCELIVGCDIMGWSRLCECVVSSRRRSPPLLVPFCYPQPTQFASTHHTAAVCLCSAYVRRSISTSLIRTNFE